MLLVFVLDVIDFLADKLNFLMTLALSKTFSILYKLFAYFFVTVIRNWKFDLKGGV